MTDKKFGLIVRGDGETRPFTQKVNRKNYPVYSGVIKYFPDAILEVSKVSLAGHLKHNLGGEMHWDKTKSTDEPDALLRHLIDHAKEEEIDEDGELHLAHSAWRALALLQRYLDEKKNKYDDFSQLQDTFFGKEKINEKNTQNTNRGSRK